jgi:hypothetical protein
MKWLSKVEIMRIPVLGWDMYLAGDIPVERGTARSAVKAMHRCQEVLKKKVSVIIFPEGTRSNSGEMLPFKDGAFRLAIDAGVPILRAPQARLASRKSECGGKGAGPDRNDRPHPQGHQAASGPGPGRDRSRAR